MKSSMKKCLLLTAAIGWALAAHGVSAESCLSPSPTVQNGGDPYGPINVRELTQEEHGTLEGLFKSLAGQWQGTSDTFFCRSSGNPEDVELGHETLKARIDVDRNGNLFMDARFYSEDRRTSSLKQMWFYLKNRSLRYNNDNGTGDVELIEISENRLAFLFRRVLQHGYSGSSRQEYFLTLTKVMDGFRIEENLYVQGRLSSGYTWQFKR